MTECVNVLKCEKSFVNECVSVCVRVCEVSDERPWS